MCGRHGGRSTRGRPASARGLELVQLKVVDHTGALHLTFFNQGYVEKALRAGEEYIFFGTVEEQGRPPAPWSIPSSSGGQPVLYRPHHAHLPADCGDLQSPDGLPDTAGPPVRRRPGGYPAPAHPPGARGWPPPNLLSRISISPLTERPWSWPGNGSPLRNCFISPWGCLS